MKGDQRLFRARQGKSVGWASPNIPLSTEATGGQSPPYHGFMLQPPGGGGRGAGRRRRREAQQPEDSPHGPAPERPAESSPGGGGGGRERGGGGGGGRRRNDGPPDDAPDDQGGSKKAGGQGRGGGGGGGRRHRDRERRPPESAWVSLADRLQMASGLFFGLYFVAHLVHQATAALGRATYEAYGGAVNGLLIDRRLDVLFVWLPLLVHLGSTAALRIHSREVRGSLRKRLSVSTGYVVLVIVVFHIWGTRVAPAESNGYDLVVRRLNEEGLLFYGYLSVFSALAVVHVAAGTINSVHQWVKDRDKRRLLDRAIIVVAGLLFFAVLAGVFAFRGGR